MRLWRDFEGLFALCRVMEKTIHSECAMLAMVCITAARPNKFPASTTGWRVKGVIHASWNRAEKYTCIGDTSSARSSCLLQWRAS